MIDCYESAIFQSCHKQSIDIDFSSLKPLSHNKCYSPFKIRSISSNLFKAATLFFSISFISFVVL